MSFMDIDQIESLSLGLAYMDSLANTWKNIDKKYTEVIFITEDGFEIGFYQKGKVANAFSKSGRAHCFISINDFLKLKKIIDKGILLLN